MKLAVDARLMAGHPRGMGQYARALVEPIRDRVVALLPRSQHTDEWACWCAGRSFFPLWEQWTLPRLARRVEATHLLCPSNTAPLARVRGMRTIVAVHDLIFLRPLSELPLSRSAYQNLGRLYRRVVVPSIVSKADVVLTVSEFTRSELRERFGVAPERVHLVPNSVGEEWFVPRPLPDADRRPYLLSVTGEAPSKNLAGLLRGFAELRAANVGRELALRVVGVKPPFHAAFMAQARALGLGDAVRFESFVSEPDLRRLYREAWAFVLPSLWEGFGIPLLEAMASGTPVACSAAASLPEVAGEAAWQFDPRSATSIAESLAAAVSDGAERARRAEAGLARAGAFARGAVSRRIARFWGAIA